MHGSELDTSQKKPLSVRLLDRSRLARERARDVSDGSERDRLLNHAQHCEAAADIAELLDRADSVGVRAPEESAQGCSR
jgi:hypothetical protein